MIKVDVRGTDRLLKRLAGISQKAYEAGQKELEASGLKIESEAKKMTIVDTGRLRSSIHMESKNRNKASYTYTDQQGNSFDGSLDVDPKELEVYVGTNVKYAYKIHRDGGVRTNSRTGGNGKGFLFIPAEQERVQLIRRLKSQLRKA